MILGYSFLQIVDFFFIYCFLGWIWETFYVSVRKKKYVNRGFLHGPLIPIYGFGGMSILACTIPVKDNLWLVFIMGMVGASVLEYITGTVMEAIFHVRYWDYSYIPTNINGYISLPTSIVWGLFSIIMIKYIHKPIEAFVFSFSEMGTEIITVVFTSLMSMDFALSLQEAFDLKELLQTIAENEMLQKAQKTVESAQKTAQKKVESAQKTVENMVSTLEFDKDVIADKIEEKVQGLGKGQYRRIKSILYRNPTANSTRYRDMFGIVKSNVSQKVRTNTAKAKNAIKGSGKEE